MSRSKKFTWGSIQGSVFGVLMYFFTMTMVQANYPDSYYEVIVKYRAGGCTETKKIVLQANSLTEAKIRAKTVAQLGVDITVSKATKIEK